MAELKTKPNNQSVTKFIEAVDDETKRVDSKALLKLMRKVTGKRPKMWGDSIVGYGSYHYIYPTGNKGDWPIVGFSPRKQALTVYIMTGFKPFAALMKKLGKHKTGKSCLYIRRLSDIDMDVLEEVITLSVARMNEKYECS